MVWRGVPLAITQTAFWWEAPDASRVRAEYLYGSYSNGRDIPDDAKRLVGRARDYEAELGTVRIGDMLLMNGTDHQMPQPWLGRVVAAGIATLDLRIDHLKRPEPGVDFLATAECYRLTSSVAFVRGCAYQSDRNDPVSSFVATYMRLGLNKSMIKSR